MRFGQYHKNITQLHNITHYYVCILHLCMYCTLYVLHTVCLHILNQQFPSLVTSNFILQIQLHNYCDRRYCPLLSNLGIIFRDSIRTRMRPSLESVPDTAADALVTNLTLHSIDCVWQGNFEKSNTGTSLFRVYWPLTFVTHPWMYGLLVAVLLL